MMLLPSSSSSSTFISRTHQEVTATIQSPSGNAVQYLSVRVWVWGVKAVSLPKTVRTVHPCQLGSHAPPPPPPPPWDRLPQVLVCWARGGQYSM